MKYSLYIIVFSTIISCTYQAESTNTLETEVFDSLVLVHKNSWKMPAMAVGVIKNDQVIYNKGIGLRGVDDKTKPLSNKSLFHMASVSKPFVATAIMQLVEQGKLDLDQRLVEHMPYFKMADSSYKSITIRQVLTHTSGIPDEDDYEWYNPQYDEGAAERYARSFKHVSLEFEPGSNHSYSNPAFDILANVIAKASGLTFEVYMKENILQPAGMVNSTFFKPEVPEHLATKPHVLGDSLNVKVNEHYPYNRRHAPSSTLHSNVEDMLKWAKLHLNNGRINGAQLFSAEAFKQLTTATLPSYDGDSIALGWFIRYVDSTKVIEHWGGDDGYLSYFGFIPDERSALTLMTNNDYYLDGFTVNILLDQLINGKTTKEWKLPIYFVLKDVILKEGIEECKRIYLEEKTNENSKYLTKNWTLNYLGYLLLEKGYGDKAEEVFQFNIELEPNNAVWHDSLGDCYRDLNKIELAIESYKKALEINPDQDYTREKLIEMTST